ncbi:hypothetical protein GCM10023195_15750 [Actinoallomurus liliacearum]|uniref:Uncharacterized protein n=1 Tax=Actinoallomurus liliacearum TaxID=1080073 RepID=A0ABP8TFM2_9ACTN
MSEPYGQPPSPNWQPSSPVPPPGAHGPGPAPYGTQPPPPGPGMAGPQAPYGQPGAQAPYGQPGAQAPYGQPGAQAPYGQPGAQAPYPPSGPYQPGPYGAPPFGGPTPAQRRKRALLVVPIALVLLIGLIVVSRLSSHSDDVAVGDCVERVTSGATQSRDDKIKKVGCTDANAGYKVVGKVEHVSKISLDIKENLSGNGKGICGQFPTATVRFWKGTSKDGYVLCMAPNQH